MPTIPAKTRRPFPPSSPPSASSDSKCRSIADRDGVIVAGHTHYLAAKELGMETVPVIVADDLTPAQIQAFRIADNKTAEIADWDYDLLPTRPLVVGTAHPLATNATKRQTIYEAEGVLSRSVSSN